MLTSALQQAQTALSLRYPYYYSWMRNIIWGQHTGDLRGSACSIAPDLRLAKVRVSLNSTLMKEVGLKGHLYLLFKVVLHLVKLHGLNNTEATPHYSLAADLQVSTIINAAGLTSPKHPLDPAVQLFPSKDSVLQLLDELWSTMEEFDIAKRPVDDLATAFPPTSAALEAYVAWLAKAMPSKAQLEALRKVSQKLVEQLELVQDAAQDFTDTAATLHDPSSASVWRTMLSNMARESQQASPPGNLSGDLTALVRIGDKAPIPWWQRFSQSLSCSQVAGLVSTSARQNRRGGFPGFRLRMDMRMLIVLDASGSMEIPLLERAFKIIKSVLGHVKVDLLVLDTQVTQFLENFSLQDLNKLDQFAVAGRGGTDMSVPIRFVRERKTKYDAIACLTDGTDAFPLIQKELRTPTLWLVLEHYHSDFRERFRPEAGTLIVIPEDQAVA